MRWLSNGYESLTWPSLTVGLLTLFRGSRHERIPGCVTEDPEEDQQPQP